jgi:hypothetical protein
MVAYLFCGLVLLACSSEKSAEAHQCALWPTSLVFGQSLALATGFAIPERIL